jgi:type III restriction enzyme
MSLGHWKAYQVTHSERRPALEAGRTLFNLVPCNRELEVAMARFADRAPDVAAFAKNGGPQCLRIDYLAAGGRLAFYTPDFFIRTSDGNYYLVETKGREDQDVPRKARAGAAWCKSASTPSCRWEYLYVPQGVFERLSGDSVGELARTCAPALQNLLAEEDLTAKYPLFVPLIAGEAAEVEKAPEIKSLVDEATLEALPPRYRKAVEQAATLFLFLENKGMNYAPLFNALLGSLDEAAKGLMIRRLQPDMPPTAPEQRAWFEPYLGDVNYQARPKYGDISKNLKKTLVFQTGISPLGLLRSCMDYALNDTAKIGGVFAAVKGRFKVQGGRDMLSMVKGINDFRNTFVAHQEKELTDARLAEMQLKAWIEGLKVLSSAN